MSKLDSIANADMKKILKDAENAFYKSVSSAKEDVEGLVVILNGASSKVIVVQTAEDVKRVVDHWRLKASRIFYFDREKALIVLRWTENEQQQLEYAPIDVKNPFTSTRKTVVRPLPAPSNPPEVAAQGVKQPQAPEQTVTKKQILW